jgi:monoamine oxidase
LLRLSAAAAGAAVLAPSLNWRVSAEEEPPSIGIVGGGVAGLTCAYRLQSAGAKPALFEASGRWGGRILTQQNFYKGMFCELGGEFVDTNHEDLQTLLKDLGLELQPFAGENEGEDLYYFKGAFHTPGDMIDPEKQTGAFAPIAEKVAEDADKLLDEEEEWTDYARELDQMTLKAYLEQFRGKTDDWAIDLLDVAYVGEFGLETQDQSSLNMVDFIGTDMNVPHQGRLVLGHQRARRRAQGQGGDAGRACVDRDRRHWREDRAHFRRSRRHEDGKL